MKEEKGENRPVWWAERQELQDTGGVPGPQTIASSQQGQHLHPWKWNGSILE